MNTTGIPMEAAYSALAGKYNFLRTTDQDYKRGGERDQDPRDGFVETRREDGGYSQAIVGPYQEWSEFGGGRACRFSFYTRELSAEGELQAVGFANVVGRQIDAAEFRKQPDGTFQGSEEHTDDVTRKFINLTASIGPEVEPTARALGDQFDKMWWHSPAGPPKWYLAGQHG